MIYEKNEQRKKIFWALTLLAYSACLYYLSSGTVFVPGPDFVYKDKLLHAFAYAIIALTAWQTFRLWSRCRRWWLWAWVYAVGYGATDEFHQYFVPGRESDMWDWVADAVGAAICLLIVEVIHHRRENRRGVAKNHQSDE